MLLLEISKYRHIVCWSQNGDAFIINKPKLFEKKIIPNYFQASKEGLDSFLRKVIIHL